MSQWTEQFENHAIHAELARVQQLIENARGSATDDVSHVEAIDRVGAVVSELSRRIAGADPNFVMPVTLNPIRERLTQLAGYLEQYAPTADATALQNCSGVTDAILGHFGQLLVARTPQEVEGIGDAVSSFRRAVGQHARRAAEDIKAATDSIIPVRAKLEEVAADITNQKARVDTFIQQAEQRVAAVEQRSAAADVDRSTKFAGEEATRRDQIQAAIAGFTEEHTAAQQRRQELFDKTAAEAKERTDQIVQQVKEAEAQRLQAQADLAAKWNEQMQGTEASSREQRDLIEKQAEEQRASLDSTAKALLGQIAELKSRAAELVGVIANSGMAGGYQLVADGERKSARTWSIVASTCMVGFVAVALFALFHGKGNAGFEWGLFASKLYVSVAFGAFATYAATQSAKHQQNERRARRLQLELASLDPYLASLPENARQEIKTKLADRHFGQIDSGPADGTEPFSSKSFFDLFADVVRTLAKKQ